MKTKIDQQGNVVLEIGNLYDFIDTLDADTLDHLADAISLKDRVVENVARQIFDGCTDLGSYAAKSHGQHYTSPLAKAIFEVATRAGEVAAKEIESLKRTCDHLEKSRNEAWTENNQLRDKLYDITRRNG